MQLLDGILAFALTMAALATVVTVIMEAGLRIVRMRKKNFIEVMKLLNKELGMGTLQMTDKDRWAFFVKVVKNPAKTAVDKLSTQVAKLPKTFAAKSNEDRIAEFGYIRSDGLTFKARLSDFFSRGMRITKRGSLYETVSLEYMLRCLASIESIKNASQTASDALKIEFNRIAIKYEEFGSSVSASFKHHSQYYSLLVGIVLAVFANVDGMRIFEAYKSNPSLAVKVIEKQEELIQSYAQAQASLEQFQKNKPDEKNDIEAIKKTVKNAQQQFSNLVTMGLPIGWDFYPNCPYDGDPSKWEQSSPKCRSLSAKAQNYQSQCVFLRVWKTASSDMTGFFVWLVTVVISGTLIGLGAPFWFDVAKRLSQIRKGLQSSSASTEYRLSAKNANGNPDERKKIIDTVLEQAAGEVAAKEALSKKRGHVPTDGTTDQPGNGLV